MVVCTGDKKRPSPETTDMMPMNANCTRDSCLAEIHQHVCTRKTAEHRNSNNAVEIQNSGLPIVFVAASKHNKN